jgi:3-methyladenine DNA glycosylase AlkD
MEKYTVSGTAVQKLFEETFKQNSDPERAKKMSAYMRNQFEYLGVATPKRQAICKDFFKSLKNQPLDKNFVNACWDCRYREFKYVAMEYIKMNKSLLTPDDVDWLKTLALNGSWWDTIDCLDKIIGSIAFNYVEVKQTLLKWSVDENIWLRRIAIDHQILAKDKTDTELLEKIIMNNFGSNEFFINKAIGWSLRDYSKTNPDWVRDFVEKHKDKMANLSIREASKYL